MSAFTKLSNGAARFMLAAFGPDEARRFGNGTVSHEGSPPSHEFNSIPAYAVAVAALIRYRVRWGAAQSSKDTSSQNLYL